MSLRLTLAGAVAAVLAGPAAIAAAQTPPRILPLTKPCYVSATQDQRELVEVHGEGFSGDTAVDVLVDDVLQPMSTQPMTNALGEIVGSVAAPFMPSGQRLFTIRLTDRSPKAITASVITKVTALSVTQSPVKASSSSKVRFRLRGFTDKTKPVYAHYVFKDKVRATVLIGKPYGDCGLLSVRRKQFPIKRPKPGSWTIQFDQDQAYNPSPPLFTRLPVKVSRGPRG